MGHYDAPTPKPHYAYSNAPAFRQVCQGKFEGWRKESERLEKEGKKVRTCVPYTDKSGKTRWKGTDQLRSTELLDCTLAACFIYRGSTRSNLGRSSPSSGTT